MTQALRSHCSHLVIGDGGSPIHVTEWLGDGPTLVCVHGLTSNSHAFAGLAAELPDWRVLAVDCRGRGGSGMAGPFGLVLHARDLAAVFDQLDLDRTTVLGHSMGAYVVSAFHDEFPDRVERLIFIDGGCIAPLAGNETADVLLELRLSPFLEKLHRSWSGIEEYRRYLESTPLYPGGMDEYGLAPLRYELGGEEPELKSRVSAQAVAADWRDILDEPTVIERLRHIGCPLLLVRAPDGLTGAGDEVMPEAICKRLMSVVPHARIESVPATNHHTILFAEAGAAAVAELLSSFFNAPRG